MKTLTFLAAVLSGFLDFFLSICFWSSMTHGSLGSVHTSRPLFMVKLWENGENRCKFGLRPYEILHYFSADADVATYMTAARLQDPSNSCLL